MMTARSQYDCQHRTAAVGELMFTIACCLRVKRTWSRVSPTPILRVLQSTGLSSTCTNLAKWRRQRKIWLHVLPKPCLFIIQWGLLFYYRHKRREGSRIPRAGRLAGSMSSILVYTDLSRNCWILTTQWMSGAMNVARTQRRLES